MTDLAVIFDELPTRDGGRVGIATLNAPKSLNALSLDMARQLDAKLQAWAVDRSIVAVWLEGSGEKAFCAGGDVVALYRSMTEEGKIAVPAAIASLPKPTSPPSIASTIASIVTPSRSWCGATAS